MPELPNDNQLDDILLEGETVIEVIRPVWAGFVGGFGLMLLLESRQ